jgi:single-stranded-DNA-specific exonuclease
VIEPRFRWLYPDLAPLDEAFVAAVGANGGSARLARVLAARGVATDEVDLFFGPALAGLHDASGMPDAERAVARIARARTNGERVLVVGDFDADGLTGLTIMVRALRALGIDAAWHVPSRLEDGHGLSMRAVELARQDGRGLVVTVDMGSSSGSEIAAAGEAGIDVIVTDQRHRQRSRSSTHTEWTPPTPTRGSPGPAWPSRSRRSCWSGWVGSRSRRPRGTSPTSR